MSASHFKELKKEAEFYSLDSIMFPLPPSWVPADPLELASDYGGPVGTITQDEQRLWYCTMPKTSSDEGEKKLMSMCECKTALYLNESTGEMHQFSHFGCSHTIATDQPRGLQCTRCAREDDGDY